MDIYIYTYTQIDFKLFGHSMLCMAERLWYMVVDVAVGISGPEVWGAGFRGCSALGILDSYNQKNNDQANVPL